MFTRISLGLIRQGRFESLSRVSSFASRHVAARRSLDRPLAPSLASGQSRESAPGRTLPSRLRDGAWFVGHLS